MKRKSDLAETNRPMRRIEKLERDRKIQLLILLIFMISTLIFQYRVYRVIYQQSNLLDLLVDSVKTNGENIRTISDFLFR